MRLDHPRTNGGKTIDFVRDSERITHTGVFADSLHVRQILINILGNAVKFTPDGGTVRFTLEEKEFDGKTVRFAFTVKDTGIGMKPEFISHIFEPFAQENNNGRTHYQGTGLGMSITKKLVELMGGTISVESEYGKGSAFTVEIPMEYNPEGAPKTVPADEIETSLKGVALNLAFKKLGGAAQELTELLRPQTRDVSDPARIDALFGAIKAAYDEVISAIGELNA